ncbi:hypothetical protein DPMN_191437 [Dreissena polymorpha]|uniref:Uncharacterized protein n=1 Tax=Dreissena polymorpha TaxID=45954 RepID=A0A9D3Y071_DREPO|nr:hypothetical protein DPMN_191437 [Dreissena polymorpha]
MESMSESLSSLTQLKTLSICVAKDSTKLWEALRGLNIKSLILGENIERLTVNHTESLSETLSSLTKLRMLSIRLKEDVPGLCRALRGLNVKSLSLKVEYRGFKVNRVELLSQSLSSLTKLETLSTSVEKDSTGLWKALRGLNIKRLSLSGWWLEGLDLNHVELMSQSLRSLTNLEKLSICVSKEGAGLWGALRGLNIKRLSLSGRLSVNNVELLSQSL